MNILNMRVRGYQRVNKALRTNYRGVWVAGFSGALVVILLIAVTLHIERRQAFSHAERQADNIALIVQKDISRNFELYGLSIQAMVDNWEDPSINKLGDDIKKRIIFDRSTNAINITSAAILNADGEVSMDLHNRDFQGQNFRDRDYFFVHQQSDTAGLFLSRPFISRKTRGANVALSRRISSKDGSFAGVAIITLSADYFKDLLSGLDLGKQGRATIVTGDGVVVMSYPYDASAIGKSGADSDVFKKSLLQSISCFVSQSAVDNQERLFVVRTVEDPTVKIMIGFATADIYAEWTAQAIPTIAVSIIFATILTFSAFALARQLQARKVAEDKLELIAHTDALTGLATRRALDIALENEMARLGRTKQLGLSVVFIDVDFFKKYNDTYGHPAGDEVLSAVGKVITSCLHRPSDYAGRYGGEEFIVVLAQTNLDGAIFIAEQIRQKIDDLNLLHEASPLNRITISAGVAVASVQISDWRELVKDADSALYEAKKAGRNVVRPANPLIKLKRESNNSSMH